MKTLEHHLKKSWLRERRGAKRDQDQNIRNTVYKINSEEKEGATHGGRIFLIVYAVFLQEISIM